MTNTEILNKIAKLSGLESFKVIASDKNFFTYEDFLNSEELKEVYSGFQSKTSITKSEFIFAFVSGKSVYVNYKIDGINFFAKETIGSCINNNGLFYVDVTEHGAIIHTEDCFDKGESNRKIWRKLTHKTLTGLN